MSSFTEELLGESLEKLKTGAEELTLKLDVTKFEVGISAINNVFFLGFEKRMKDLIVHTHVLGGVDKARQERKRAMLREIYDSEVVIDLVKARELRGELDGLFQDLESFKASALREEQMSKKGLSNLELLTKSDMPIQPARGTSGTQKSRVEKRVHVKEHWRRRPTRKPKANTSKAK